MAPAILPGAGTDVRVALSQARLWLGQPSMCGWKGGEHGARAAPHRRTAPGAPRLPASLPSSCLQVILAMLWLAASESQPPGCQDCAMPRGQRVLVQPPITPQRRAARPPCPAGMNWIEGARRCCAQCPAGESHPGGAAWHGTLWHTRHIAPGGHAPCHPTVSTGTFLLSPCSSHSNNSVCATCPPGTFRAQPNTFPKCQACYECDHQGELAPYHVTPCHAARCCAVPCSAVLCHSLPVSCSFPECAEQLLGHQQRCLRLQARPLPRLPRRALQRLLLPAVPALHWAAHPAAL